MNSVNDGGPAFPCVDKVQTSEHGDQILYGERGMSLRDWFAGMALQGILASRSAIEREHTYEDVAEVCFANADAMIKAREVNE